MKLYNTLAKAKEELKTVETGKVKMYVCGPTTYNYIHLGNARPIVVFDTIRQFLRYKGYQVTYVQNFTDIDDKIINRANEEQVDPLVLAQKYIEEYFVDADALKVQRADIHPRVSDHLPEIIETIQTLIDNNYAYELDGDVYYHISQFSQYGKLSGRTIEEMQAGARIDVNQNKKHPMDFVLWKRAKPGEPAWNSPWGKGRPGWHIECSAMAIKYLGEQFDIHGGGYDLVFPHHENEIAQSEAYTGKPFANYWLHNGFITVNQEKMSKSLGNFFLVREILEKYDPEVVRYYLLATHYRSPLDFDDQKLESSTKSYQRIVNTVERVTEQVAVANEGEAGGKLGGELTGKVDLALEQFDQAMSDDFNTALGFAAIFDLVRETNQYLKQCQEGEEQIAGDCLKKVLEAFGVFGKVLGLSFDIKQDKGNNDELTEKLLDLLLDLRKETRQKKDFQTADSIRERLKELGILIEDTPQGARWKWQ
ncbi:MAG: cysteine--tRNA ligase [Clostridia bacterium]|nr:cysteine--tRNA ligase [Clostridia bacterium]